MNLEEIINGVRPLDQKAMELCKKRWNTLGKPLYSLGRLEEMVIQMAGIYRHPMAKPKKKAVVVMAADNGVVAEGVTQTGQEVTKIVTENMTKHNASVCIMSSLSGADVFPVDIGIVSDVTNPKVISKKIKSESFSLRLNHRAFRLFLAYLTFKILRIIQFIPSAVKINGIENIRPYTVRIKDTVTSVNTWQKVFVTEAKSTDAPTAKNHLKSLLMLCLL